MRRRLLCGGNITRATVDASEAAVITVDNDNLALLIAETETSRAMEASLCTNSIVKSRNARGAEGVERGRWCLREADSRLSEKLVDPSPFSLLLDTSLFESLFVHPCTTS